MSTVTDCDQCGGPLPSDLIRRRARRHRGECWRLWRTNRSRRYYDERAEERKAYARSYRATERDQIREANRRRNRLLKYGLTDDAYQALLAEQGGLCAICGELEERYIAGQRAPLSVDHDHQTGAVRGLLCARCNSVLAFIENRERLTAALAYLSRALEVTPRV